MLLSNLFLVKKLSVRQNPLARCFRVHIVAM